MINFNDGILNGTSNDPSTSLNILKKNISKAMYSATNLNEYSTIKQKLNIIHQMLFIICQKNLTTLLRNISHYSKIKSILYSLYDISKELYNYCNYINCIKNNWPIRNIVFTKIFTSLFKNLPISIVKIQNDIHFISRKNIFDIKCNIKNVIYSVENYIIEEKIAMLLLSHKLNIHIIDIIASYL